MDTKEALADILDPAKETLEPELVATLEPEPEAKEESPSIQLTVPGATNRELAERLGISPGKLKGQSRYVSDSGNVWVRRGESFEACWYLEE